jgi:hypothetical protein
MPIQIDRNRAANLATEFDEALELVRNGSGGIKTIVRVLAISTLLPFN